MSAPAPALYSISTLWPRQDILTLLPSLFLSSSPLLSCCSCHFPFQPWLCPAVQCVAGRRSSQQAAAAWLERCLLSSSCEMKMALMAVAVTVATSSTLRSPLYLLWCCYLLCMSLLTLPSAGPVQLRAAGRTKSIKEAPCPLGRAGAASARLAPRRPKVFKSSCPFPSRALPALRACVASATRLQQQQQLLWQRLLLLFSFSLLFPLLPLLLHLLLPHLAHSSCHPSSLVAAAARHIPWARNFFALFKFSSLASCISLTLSLALFAAFYLPFLLFIFF